MVKTHCKKKINYPALAFVGIDSFPNVVKFWGNPAPTRKALSSWLKSWTNPPATSLILLLQAMQHLVVNYVWFETNCTDCCQVPETLLPRLCQIPSWQTSEPFSFLTKELVKDWQDRGVCEEVWLVEFSNLDSSVGPHIQVDVVTPVQEILCTRRWI